MKELQQVARTIGLPYNSRANLDLRSLRDAEKPIILHGSAIVEVKGEPAQQDHFVLLIENYEDQWLALDGTNCTLSVVQEKQLARGCSGYGLILDGGQGVKVSKGSQSLLLNQGLWASVVCLLFANTWLFVKGRKKN